MQWTIGQFGPQSWGARGFVEHSISFDQLLEQSKAEKLWCVRLCQEALCTKLPDCLHVEKWKQAALQDFLYFAIIRPDMKKTD